MWILYYIGRFPHFLDIRQFMGKPRNVDTFLYREVSTFLDIRQCEGFPSKNVETSIYSKVSTFLGFSVNYRISKNVETSLYSEVSTFQGFPMNCRISKKMWKPPYIETKMWIPFFF